MSAKTHLPKHPRIAVVGAGVLGTIFGAKLAAAGENVTVVERAESRAAAIRNNGLAIERLDGTGFQSSRVSVVDELDADAQFDLAIVMARKTHLSGILTMLAPTSIPNILFMVSNAEGPGDIVAAVGDRAILGFPGAGGRIIDGVVRYSIPPAAMQPTMIGEVDGTRTDRVESLARLIRSAGFHAKIAKNMDAWLKSHEAFVAATGNATYIVGSGAAVAADRTILDLNIRAIREVYGAMDAANIALEPSWLRLWQRLPLPVIRASYGRFVGSAGWDELGTEQLHSMRDEVEKVTDELIVFARQTSTPTPAFDELVRRRGVIV